MGEPENFVDKMNIRGQEPAKCCIGDWNPDCWDIPSADNFQHACATCCGSCSVFSSCGNCADFDGDCSQCSDGCVNGTCTAERSSAGDGAVAFAFIIVGSIVGGICLLCCLIALCCGGGIAALSAIGATRKK